MKYAFAIAAILSTADGQRRGRGMNIPDDAVGACNTTEDCGSDTYCVFSVSRSSGSDPVWTPSVCGSLSDCEVPV